MIPKNYSFLFFMRKQIFERTKDEVHPAFNKNISLKFLIILIEKNVWFLGSKKSKVQCKIKNLIFC